MARRLCILASTALLLVLAPLLAPAAGLSFPQSQVDVGEVHTGPPLTHRFAFANSGPETITVTAVRTSCGCLRPTLESSGPGAAAGETGLPQSYPPGAQGTLLLEATTLGQPPDSHTWHATVCWQQGKGPVEETDLELKAHLVCEVTVQPASLTVFANPGLPLRHQLVLTDLRPHPLTVVAVQSSSSQVSGQIMDRLQDHDSHTQYKIDLAISADYPAGRHEETLDIVTDDPAYRSLRVPLTIVQRDGQRLTASPNLLTLSSAGGRIRIRDRDEQPVMLESVEAEDPAIACQWSHGASSLALIKVRVDRSRLSGPSLRSVIHVATRQPVREELTIPVVWTPDPAAP